MSTAHPPSAEVSSGPASARSPPGAAPLSVPGVETLNPLAPVSDALRELPEFIRYLIEKATAPDPLPLPASLIGVVLLHQAGVTPCHPVKVGHLDKGEIGQVQVTDPLGRGVTVAGSGDEALTGADNGNAGRTADNPFVETLHGPMDVWVHLKPQVQGKPLTTEDAVTQGHARFFGPAEK